MIVLESYVSESGDQILQQIQHISRLTFQEFIDIHRQVDEFINLFETHCKFVEDFSADVITPSTYQLYSKQVPSNYAAKYFVQLVHHSISRIFIREQKEYYVEKSRLSHQE